MSDYFVDILQLVLSELRTTLQRPSLSSKTFDAIWKEICGASEALREDFDARVDAWLFRHSGGLKAERSTIRRLQHRRAFVVHAPQSICLCLDCLYLTPNESLRLSALEVAPLLKLGH